MIGKILADRYKIIEEVGVGGMAIVYKAEDILLRREVAVKILKEQFSEDPEFSDKFEIEAQSAASLSHPNIVSIYDVGSEKIENRNVQYIVMELIKGKTLKEIIVENTYLSNEDTVNYSRQIAEALRAAHKNNIIHRDIKPQNIMVTEEGMAKVTDFGIARISTSATITYTSSILGTVHYISPEQAKGKFIDNKSDLYSLGIVMYEMVTGKVPFDAENSVSIALKHIQDEVIPPKKLNPGVSDKLNYIILKCLEKNPEDRFANAQELIDALNSDDIFVVTPLLDEIEEEEEEDKVSVYVANKKRYKNDEREDNKTLRRLLTAAILAVVSVTLGFFILTNIRDNAMAEVSVVPDVINQSEEEAVSTLEEAGFDSNIIKRTNKDIHEGYVYEQSPSPGEEISEGSSVDIIVSAGVEEKIMPNLIGMDIESARSTLNSEGLILNSESYEESDEADGTIISQHPNVGETVNSQTQISVVISQSEQRDLVTMPSLLGSSQTAAVSSLIDNGLVVGTIDRMTSNDYPEGTVMWQSYDEGTTLEPGSKIDIIVSKGSQDVPEFDLPQGTVDLTGGDTENVKLYTFTIQPPNDRDTFNLKVVRVTSSGQETIYNQDHTSDRIFELNFLDYNTSQLEIYYDDQLVASTS